MASGAVTGNVKQFDREAFRLAVRRGVQGGKVAVFWNLTSRLFVADCFYPGCTEGALDSDFLFPYLWEPEWTHREKNGGMPTIEDIRKFGQFDPDQGGAA